MVARLKALCFLLCFIAVKAEEKKPGPYKEDKSKYEYGKPELVNPKDYYVRLTFRSFVKTFPKCH